jgi:RimJ/RimL family protein N-acetyltransferase
MNKNISYFNQKSARLTYRKVTDKDIPIWESFFKDNDRLYFLGLDETKSHHEMSKNWIGKQLRRYIEEGFGLLAVIENSTGNFIGMCGLLQRVIEDKKELEVGYSFIKEFWGKGYASEAANHMRIFAVENQFATRLISIIHEDNLDSMKVAERNQMQAKFKTKFLDMPVVVYTTD